MSFASIDCRVGWGSSTLRGGGQKGRSFSRKFLFLGLRSNSKGGNWDVQVIFQRCPGLLVKNSKTTPTPNKNGSYGIEVGVRIRHKSRSLCAIKVGVLTPCSP